jgi:hypothetical protein
LSDALTGVSYWAPSAPPELQNFTHRVGVKPYGLVDFLAGFLNLPKLCKSFMTNERRFYTYAYLREDRTPYYIGKGTGRRAFNPNRRLKVPPKDRILFLKTGLTEEEAHRHEVYMIALFGRKDLGTGILRNLTNGGEGSSGLVPSEKAIEALRQRNIGNTYMKGRPVSEETREKIRQKHLGKKISKEAIEKRKLATKGKKRKPHSEETKEKIRQSKLGKKRDPETIKKMSEGRKGKGCIPCSEEKKKKIGDANRGHSRPWSEERRENYRRKVAEGRMTIPEETP